MTLHLWSHWFWVTRSGQGLLLFAMLMTIISVGGLPTTHQMLGTSSVIPSEKSEVTQTGGVGENDRSVPDDLGSFDSPDDFFQNTDSSIDVLTTPLSVQNTSIVHLEKTLNADEGVQENGKLMTTVVPSITSSASPTAAITTTTVSPHEHRISEFQHDEEVQGDQSISQRIGKAIGLPPPSSTASTLSTSTTENIVETDIREETIVENNESVKIVETKDEEEIIHAASPPDAAVVPQYVDDSTAGTESNLTKNVFDVSYKEEQDDGPYENDKNKEGINSKVDDVDEEEHHPIKESVEDAASQAKDVNKYQISVETTTESPVEARIWNIVTSPVAPSSPPSSTVSDYDEVPSDAVQINDDEDKTSAELAEIEYDMTSPEVSPPAPPSDSLLPTPATAVTGGRIGGAPPGLDAGTIVGITVGSAVFAGLLGSLAYIVYRRRLINKPQALSDKCSNPDSSGYLDDTLRVSRQSNTKTSNHTKGNGNKSQSKVVQTAVELELIRDLRPSAALISRR